MAAHAKNEVKSLKITHIELCYPHPAIPFYHFKADFELPEASMIEVETVIDGKTLRFVNLYKGDVMEKSDKPGYIHHKNRWPDPVRMEVKYPPVRTTNRNMPVRGS
jgi:hypothetical protein